MLLNLIKHQRTDIEKINLYVKDLFESKYQQLINVREKIEIKKIKNPNALSGYSQAVDDLFDNFKDCNVTEPNTY